MFGIFDGLGGGFAGRAFAAGRDLCLCVIFGLSGFWGL